MSLCGRREGNSFRLGDRLLVVVAKVDLDRRELDFGYVKHVGEAKRPPRDEKSRAKKTRPSKPVRPGERGSVKPKKRRRR
jgi:hypothetical protein